MIEVKDVIKSYDGKNNIVKGVSFEVKPGEIYGLLGPNGAGKTTLMQMISTLLKPDSGYIKIGGIDTRKGGNEIHRKIGFLTSEVKLDPLSTPDKLFNLFSDLYDIPKEEAKVRKEELFVKFGIDKFKNQRIRDLSTGMKQKISIAISVIHKPDVVIFDEPTNGLDILTSKQVTDYLVELKKSGCAVILSTHIFSLTEKLCDRIGILVNGKIVESGTADELCKKTQSTDFEEAFFKIYSKYHEE